LSKLANSDSSVIRSRVYSTYIAPMDSIKLEMCNPTKSVHPVPHSLCADVCTRTTPEMTATLQLPADTFLTLCLSNCSVIMAAQSESLRITHNVPCTKSSLIGCGVCCRPRVRQSNNNYTGLTVCHTRFGSNPNIAACWNFTLLVLSQFPREIWKKGSPFRERKV